MTPIWVAVIGGLVGGAVAPILLELFRQYQRDKSWKRPRKALLKRKLELAPGEGWVSIEVLARLCGISPEECRSLLIEIEARGGTLRDDREGWALIARRPLEGSATEGVE